MISLLNCVIDIVFILAKRERETPLYVMFRSIEEERHDFDKISAYESLVNEFNNEIIPRKQRKKEKKLQRGRKRNLLGANEPQGPLSFPAPDGLPAPAAANNNNNVRANTNPFFPPSTYANAGQPPSTYQSMAQSTPLPSQPPSNFQNPNLRNAYQYPKFNFNAPNAQNQT